MRRWITYYFWANYYGCDNPMWVATSFYLKTLPNWAKLVVGSITGLVTGSLVGLVLGEWL